jgi:hypothetical protein
VTNEHVIEDLVDVNYGIDESAPLIKFETETDKRYSVADMKALIDAGALTTDSELEAYIPRNPRRPPPSTFSPETLLPRMNASRRARRLTHL